MNDGGLLIATGIPRAIPPSDFGTSYLIETDNTGNPRYVYRHGGADTTIIMNMGVRADGQTRRFVGYSAAEGFPPHGFRYYITTSLSGELLSWGFREEDQLTTNYTITAAVGDSGIIEASQYTDGDDEKFGDIILRRIDAWGNQLWTSRYVKDINSSTVLPLALRQLKDGGYAMTLFYDNPPFPISQAVVRFNAAGSVRWIHHFDTTFNGLTSLSDAPGDGLYVLTTEHLSTRTIVTRLDANGDIVWKRYYPDKGSMIAVTAVGTMDGGLAIAGLVGRMNDQNRLIDSTLQFYVAKLLSSGDIDWEIEGGRSGVRDILTHIGLDRDGRIILLGSMQDPARPARRELYVAALPDAKLGAPAARDRAGALMLAATPNPASSFITAHYHLRAPGGVRFALIDPLGNDVATWIEDRLEAEEGELRLDLPPLASGPYFLHLRSGASSAAVPVVIVR
jgi:hypothetical protein